MPKFINISGSLVVEYKGLDGLLSHSVCNQWRRSPGFIRFSVKHDWIDGFNDPYVTLMAEFEEGYWFTVGYLDHDPELPIFRE